MLSLYETKLEKLDQIKSKYLNELDYNNILLHVIMLRKNDKFRNEYTIPLKGLKQPIKIPDINQNFDIENHFEYLFINDDTEYHAEFDVYSFTCYFKYNENMNDAEREKMNKLRTSLTSFTTKSNKIKTDRKYYNDIYDGLNNNNSSNKNIEFLYYLNKLFLVNSVDEEEHFNNSIDNSVKLFLIFSLCQTFPDQVLETYSNLK
jgi:hypothetical protein